MSCPCDYSNKASLTCRACSCLIVVNEPKQTQKLIWNQVRVPASTYLMNLSALTSAANRLATPRTNWNQMSDRVLAAQQPNLNPSRGNSLHTSITRERPGAGTPSGAGVDVKHDSYARFLNRKKAAAIVKPQTNNIASVPIKGNKIQAMGIVANSINCCA